VKRGDLYLVRRPRNDPKSHRIFVVVNRQDAIGSRLPALICAPVHTKAEGFLTQVRIGPGEGLKHESWILCDLLTSVPRSKLTNYLGTLRGDKIAELNRALRVALDLI
jgi:mRNA interferase MazF